MIDNTIIAIVMSSFGKIVQNRCIFLRCDLTKTHRSAKFLLQNTFLLQFRKTEKSREFLAACLSFDGQQNSKEWPEKNLIGALDISSS